MWWFKTIFNYAIYLWAGGEEMLPQRREHVHIRVMLCPLRLSLYTLFLNIGYGLNISYIYIMFSHLHLASFYLKKSMITSCYIPSLGVYGERCYYKHINVTKQNFIIFYKKQLFRLLTKLRTSTQMMWLSLDG